MKYYAKLWNCGKSTRRADTGRNQVIVYSFASQTARNTACAEYRAPNHCPSAELEPILASDEDVRREKRDCGIQDWENE